MIRLCFISYMYPGKHNSSDYAFVKQLVDAIAARGNECYVIAPYNVNHYFKYTPIRESYTVGLGSVSVFRPWYLSFSAKLGCLYRLSGKQRRRALQKAFKMLPHIPDAIYGHFWHGAFGGYEYAKEHNLPLFVASGESEVLFRNNTEIKNAFCEYVKGVICVSTKNRDESVKLGLTRKEKCIVAPNAINNTIFRTLDRKRCREVLGLPESTFIVSFVGWFNERKGPLRLLNAIQDLDGVYSLFIGKGEMEPVGDNILFKGSVEHDMVPFYLNASDIFVLPTLHEGCCNAVVEAMACGLPVVSSDLPFNWDILNENNSIMVNPTIIDEIRRAIIKLRDDVGLRQKLSNGALETAQTLTIEKRAEIIEKFIENSLVVFSCNDDITIK